MEEGRNSFLLKCLCEEQRIKMSDLVRGEITSLPLWLHFIIVKGSLLSEGSKYHCVFFTGLRFLPRKNSVEPLKIDEISDFCPEVMQLLYSVNRNCRVLL